MGILLKDECKHEEMLSILEKLQELSPRFQESGDDSHDTSSTTMDEADIDEAKVVNVIKHNFIYTKHGVGPR